jgi:hypothetical protein
VLTFEQKAGFGILEAAQLDSSSLTEYLGSGRVAKLFDAKEQVLRTARMTRSVILKVGTKRNPSHKIKHSRPKS